MPTIEVHYGGETYMIVGRGIDDVQSELDGIIASGVQGWLTAYDGHGSRAPFRLLITTGTPVALAELPAE